MEETTLALAPAVTKGENAANPESRRSAVPIPKADPAGRSLLRRTFAPGAAESVAGIAHDARNIVTALKLCAELVAEPGVLAKGREDFGDEVRSVVAGMERVVRRLSTMARPAALAANRVAVITPLTDMAEELRLLRGLLAAVAGPAVSVEVTSLPCAGRLELSEESLTRILLNLVRNAAEAMPKGGRIRITAQRGGGESFLWLLAGGLEVDGARSAARRQRDTVVLCVEDSGPGIPPELLDRVFEPGFSTRRDQRPWPEAQHHGLGLSIVRELVEEAGGSVRFVLPRARGARFEIELPLTNVTPSLLSEPPLPGRSGAR